MPRRSLAWFFLGRHWRNQKANDHLAHRLGELGNHIFVALALSQVLLAQPNRIAFFVGSLLAFLLYALSYVILARKETHGLH